MDVESGGVPRLHLALLRGDKHREQLEKLLDSSFPVKPGGHFFDDFPVWDEKLNPGGADVFRLGIFEGELLVSSASLRIARLKCGQGKSPITVGVIGAVATAESWRGAGLASTLVSRITEIARDSEVSLLMLWGSELNFYRRLGFELCGEQLRAPLATLGLAGEAAETQIHEGWQPALFEALKKRTGGLDLGPEDQRWLEAHRNVSWFYTGDRAHPTAYAAMGRGIDLAGMVHEWGGEKRALAGILSRILELQPEASLLGSRTLFEKYGISTSSAIVESLFLAKILDPVALVRGFLPAQEANASYKKGKWDLALGQAQWGGLEERELAQLLLNRIPGVPQDVARILPIPLWIWGLDGA